jgi:hypothetical protein
MFEIGGKQIAETLVDLVQPKRTALLIWDMEYAIARTRLTTKRSS